MARQICECGLQYRYEEDFEEHKRVGCVVPSGEGSTWHDLPAEGESQPEEETKEKKSKKSEKSEKQLSGSDSE